MGRNVPGPDDRKAPQAPKDCQTPNGFARAKHVADVGSKREMLKKVARYQLLVDFAERSRASIAERTAKARVLARAIWTANADRHAAHVLVAIIRDGWSKLDRCTNNLTRAFSLFVVAWIRATQDCLAHGLQSIWGPVKKRIAVIPVVAPFG
jgi:hypothetical protein